MFTENDSSILPHPLYLSRFEDNPTHEFLVGNKSEDQSYVCE